MLSFEDDSEIEDAEFFSPRTTKTPQLSKRKVWENVIENCTEKELQLLDCYKYCYAHKKTAEYEKIIIKR
jgi:hypothetical protein